MSSRKYSPFPDWNTMSNARNAKWLAKQAAARAAARSTVVQKARGNVIPMRLPITIPMRMFAPRVGEMKSVDVPQSGTTFNTATTFSIGLLNGIAPGTARYQRVGNKITPQLVDFQAVFVNGGTTNNPYCRIALIWDKQPTGVLPALDDIYQNVSALGATSTTGWPGRNMNTTDRFITIASQDFFLLLLLLGLRSAMISLLLWNQMIYLKECSTLGLSPPPIKPIKRILFRSIIV